MGLISKDSECVYGLETKNIKSRYDIRKENKIKNNYKFFGWRLYKIIIFACIQLFELILYRDLK